MSAGEARSRMSTGEIVATITIPRGFSSAISRGKTVLLPVTVDNVNADLTDDIREAVPSAITSFGHDSGFPGIRLAAVERDLIDHDTGYIPYLVVSALALTAFVVAGILGAVAITRELEAGTLTQWRLAPVHVGYLLAGKLLAAALVSALAVGAAALVVILGYGVKPEHPLAAFGSLAISVGIFTCVGACAGAILRRTLPVAALFFGLALPFYIDSGALEPLRFDGNKVWVIGHTSPVYPAIGVLEYGFHGFHVTPESVPQNLLVLAAWAIVALLLAAAVLQNRVVRR
jgi:ABC-type transport system involved in multi-copper enzyme maturation permease subunit